MITTILIFCAYVIIIGPQMLFITGTSYTYWERNIHGKRSPKWKDTWFLNMWHPQKIGGVISIILGFLPPLGFIYTMILFRPKYWAFRDMTCEKTLEM